MTHRCSRCEADLAVDDHGVVTTRDGVEIEYSLHKCSNGHYSLEAESDALEEGRSLSVMVAARQPFDDGKWVRLEE